MSYNPAVVANALLHEGMRRGVSFDHMKLQKLVYLVHAWHLALNNQPAVNMQPEAWDYGPVFGFLYSQLKSYGRAAIDKLIPTWDQTRHAMLPLIPSDADAAIWNVVRQVLDRYGHLSAVQLSTLSHEPGGPWDQAYRTTKVMDNNLIQAHYRAKLERGIA